MQKIGADDQQASIGIANLGVHEVAHDVTSFHLSGDAIMDVAADDPKWLFNPDNRFSQKMRTALQKKYNKKDEKPGVAISIVKREPE